MEMSFVFNISQLNYWLDTGGKVQACVASDVKISTLRLMLLFLARGLLRKGDDH